MKKDATLLWGSILGGLAVVFGAFGAHSLKSFLMESGRTETFELAVRYQFYHALALLAVGILMGQGESRRLRYCGIFFLLGAFFFSGSLYILCFSGIKMLGAVTPFGGVFFIVGWILLGLAAIKK